MAKQLEQWTEGIVASDDAALITLHLQQGANPFPLEWYKSNPRLTMDRLAKFEGNPEFTPYYDEGDI